MDLGCTKITVTSESQACEMHLKSRVELGRAILTVETEGKVCEIHKTSRYS